MYPIMYYTHIISAIALAVYLFLPMMIRVGRHPGANVTEGYVKRIVMFNRIGQFALILAFLSGGYMVSKVGFSVLWMIVSIVLLLIIGAMGGMMGKPLKRWAASITNKESSPPDLSKLSTFSLIASVSYVVTLIVMLNPTLL